MRVIEITQHGGPDVLQIRERPIPVFKAGELLIKVQVAGVNRPDVFQRSGNYAPPPDASDLPGLEVAGEIVDGDFSETHFKKGDLVCALVPGGGYAEYCTTPAVQCLPIPKNWTVLEAASLPETFFTVWSNVFERGRLTGNETLLVQGGSSGIGAAAIQIATALGHQVFATAGSDEKCRACEDLGAVRAINYRTEDFVEVVKSLTAGKGVDVILDMVAGDYAPREIDCMAEDGRLVFIATLGGNSAKLNFSKIMMRRLTITGSTLRPRPIAFKGAVAAQLQTRIWPLLAAGEIKPVIFKTFPLEQAAQAHALMESSTHIGKIMLTIDGPKDQQQ
ncbi:NAD(P)H-quinone oxidoreductase [Glaciimonas sp. CA11.2]|uniref:NAD(P)H-quinone oxidoreductase n=1 Tax=Glaciimonas sp. CA11.2 TaxID=3048601 RepID=UPI002AB5DB63|nr:NAD(P)H-quinone oxidoreductase [Glaciimonas sp. CA11.2]MDY7547316.1 NAD(P)H-quinone oxidoreductase [Glaciimonas sp. CA11.2]MEB0163199.1 NAD(P)H-quinone oxidoreductase [Glaciimonas sp. CA11.2]